MPYPRRAVGAGCAGRAATDKHTDDTTVRGFQRSAWPLNLHHGNRAAEVFGSLGE
jgi:hypothetical protein